MKPNNQSNNRVPQNRSRSRFAHLLVICGDLLSMSLHATDFYVAPAGHDANPGSEGKPFATLSRARDAVRAELKKNPGRDYTVLLRGGTYRLTEPVVFGLEDSAPKERTITYEAYPDEVPVLNGTVELTGWTKLEPIICFATLRRGSGTI